MCALHEVGRHAPDALLHTLHDPDATQRFEPSHVNVGRDLRVFPCLPKEVGQMICHAIDAVAGHAADGAIDRPHLARRTHFHDAVHRQGSQIDAGGKSNVVRTPIDAVHHQIAEVVHLVDQALASDAAHDRC